MTDRIIAGEQHLLENGWEVRDGGWMHKETRDLKPGYHPYPYYFAPEPLSLEVALKVQSCREFVLGGKK